MWDSFRDVAADLERCCYFRCSAFHVDAETGEVLKVEASLDASSGERSPLCLVSVLDGADLKWIASRERASVATVDDNVAERHDRVVVTGWD